MRVPGRRPKVGAGPGAKAEAKPPRPPRDWGGRGQFLLANSQLFFAALTAVLCLAALLAGLRAPFFAPWLAIACLVLFSTGLLLVGDLERLLRDKVSWVAVHYLGFTPGLYLVGYALERRAGPRVARPFYVVAAVTGLVAAIVLARFGTQEWFHTPWDFHGTVWNLWLAAYSVPFFLWAWLTERYGTEGQRPLSWWLYLLVPVSLLFPLQVLFAKGPTLFATGGQPFHIYAALYLLACVVLLVLGRLLHLELFLVAALWGSAVWVFRTTYRHFWEQEGWALAIAATGVLLVGLGVWRSWRGERSRAPRRPRPEPRSAAAPAAPSTDEGETAALPS